MLINPSRFEIVDPNIQAPAGVKVVWVVLVPKSIPKQAKIVKYAWLLLADPPLVTSDLVGYWLTHLWSPLTWWVSPYSALWARAPAQAKAQAQAQAQAQAPAQAQKVSTGLTRLYRGFYSAVMDFPRLNHSF